VENLSKLIGDAYNEERSLPRAIAANDRTGLHLFYLNKLILCYLFGEKYQAAQNAAEAEQYLDGVVGALVVALFHFYDSLAHLGVFASSSNSEKEALLNRVNTNQEKMHKWANHAPRNYMHKFYLVEAEKARVLGQIVEAEEFYEQAIKGANDNGFIQEEALAYELAAKFYLARGMEKIAQTYMKEAHYTYTLWGATAKVKDLESRYPQFFAKRLLNLTRTTQTIADTSTKTSIALDLLSIVKASQALSGELVLDTLLGKLMKLVIEYAGAEKGYLILEKSGQWAIAAVGAVNEAEVAVWQCIPVEQSSDVPAAIVHYVDRTQENLVLEDAAEQPLFEADPYLQLHRPKSVLCVPILNQGKRLGILYLENKLVAGAFTSDRLEVLKILCSQAAVSLENALLYEQLEDYSHTLEGKVRERTQELQEKNEQLEHTLQQLQAAQRQIIVQEKLASLGSLTAGIAHEIRNPLNFVNNFAAVSLDIIQELITELANQSEPLEAKTVEPIDETLIDLKENLAEINRQGQKAGRIIQNMLMLARQGSSQPQLTHLNTLLADSIHLAYHSLRAKDPIFNISIETHYDDSLGQVTVVPQNISRAFINVIENACYAVNAKKKTMEDVFIPLVLTRTRNLGERVEICIRDNGQGIEPDNLEKIFEPFFTTKPPGEGTGLGLFLTYDIVVGQHRGEIKVDSQLGVYTEFIIVLPKQ
jgi:signal transduction histidine kinase